MVISAKSGQNLSLHRNPVALTGREMNLYTKGRATGPRLQIQERAFEGLQSAIFNETERVHASRITHQASASSPVSSIQYHTSFLTYRASRITPHFPFCGL